MVVFDIPKKLYDSYKLWEIKQVPAVIFEVTSGSTRASDLTKKKDLYEGVGVREYWLFDPFGEWVERQNALAEKQRADRLADRLRQLGVD